MHTAADYATIILSLTDEEVMLVREDDAFHDIVSGLSQYRASASVAAALERLIGTTH